MLPYTEWDFTTWCVLVVLLAAVAYLVREAVLSIRQRRKHRHPY